MRLHAFPLLSAGIMLATLTGCSAITASTPASTNPSQGRQALSQASDCCQSLAALPYQPLQTNQSLELDFNATTPAHRFPDGKSFFHAFALPDNGQPLTLQVTSPISEQQVFAPSIMLLDEQFQPVRQLSSDQLHYQGPNGFRDARLSGAASVLPGPDAAYVVIYTSTQDRQATTTYENPEKAYARVRGLAVPNIADPEATHTATGTITLEVSPLGDNGLLAPLLGHTSPTSLNASGSAQPRSDAAAARKYRTVSPPAPATPAAASASSAQPEMDYRRMIRAALKAGDIELALQLADRAEREGQKGTRAWLAKQLSTRSP